MSRGLIAIGSGDALPRASMRREARRLAPGEPLALLLTAQTAQLAGDRAGGGAAFPAMARRDDTKLLGLHGLYRRGAAPRRRRRRAPTPRKRRSTRPRRPGPARRCWNSAARRATGPARSSARAQLSRSGLIDRATYRRQRAVLLTAQALGAGGHRPRARASLALEAREARADAGAGGGARRPAARRGRRAAQGRRASSRRPGRPIRIPISPTPTRICAPATPRATGSRASRRWREKAPGNVEGALAVARAALDAQEFAIARAALAPLARRADPARRAADGGARGSRARRRRPRPRMDGARGACARAIRPGPPTASCPTAGCRCRRSPAGSMPSSGRMPLAELDGRRAGRSSHAGAAGRCRRAQVIAERPPPPSQLRRRRAASGSRQPSSSPPEKRARAAPPAPSAGARTGPIAVRAGAGGDGDPAGACARRSRARKPTRRAEPEPEPPPTTGTEWRRPVQCASPGYGARSRLARLAKRAAADICRPGFKPQ